MSGLSGTLSIALSALAASEQALATTSNNVANANTPGFSRQRPVLAASTPVVQGQLTFGTGVVLQKIESLRDPILEIQLNQVTAEQSKLDAALTQLQQIQTQFAGSTSGIGADISKFFDSLQQLSPDPSNLALRQSVLDAAGALAADFNTAANALQTQRGNIDLNVEQSVGQVNTLTAQIAGVNQQIANLENAHLDASSLVDTRTNLIRQLSGLIDVAVVPTDQGITLATSDGTTLVAGSQSFALTTQLGPDNVHHVLAGTRDITASLTGGSLGGLVEVRDQTIPGLSGGLDQLAAGLANALNTAHQQGFDRNGNAGGNLFVPPPAGGVGAAAGLKVAITDPALLAASSNGSQGNNGNIAVLAAVHDQAVANGQTPLDFYSNIVFQVGIATSNTSADSDAAGLVRKQLEDQRGSISGVSLNEEAANMIQYQAAYQAAARVVSTVNALLSDAVNLGLGAPMQ